MFHIFWPACAFLTMFVVVVIMAILKYGPQYCKTRHTTLPHNDEDWDRETYSHEVSVSVS